MRDFIRERWAKGLELCEKYLAKVGGKWNERHCGFHFWLEFPMTNIRKTFSRNMSNSFYPGYFFDKLDTTHIMLCPASIREDMLEPAIREIAEMVRN